MTTTLTQRYIAATTASLPPAAQPDVRAELEASITDAVDARVERGEGRVTAERAVLTELGDPAALAAGYADRPLHLVGPRYYLTWWRLLKVLLIIVPLCGAGGAALAHALDGAPVATIIGQAFAVGLSAIVHVAFWVTIVFVILERTGADAGAHWDVDQLPTATSTGSSELIGSLSFLGLFAGAVLWDQLRGFVRTDDQAIPVLSPQLWPTWILALLAVLLLEAAFAVMLYRAGRWTTRLALLNTALALIFATWAMTLLGRGQLVNAEVVNLLLANGVDHGSLRVMGVLTAFGVVGVSAWDVVDGWLKSHRDGRAPSGC